MAEVGLEAAADDQPAADSAPAEDTKRPADSSKAPDFFNWLVEIASGKSSRWSCTEQDSCKENMSCLQDSKEVTVMHDGVGLAESDQVKVPDVNATLVTSNSPVPSLDLAAIVEGQPKVASVEQAKATFEVALLREGAQWHHLGLTLGTEQSPNYLTVKKVWSPSLISDWNDQHRYLKVGVGDHITAVNGVKSNSPDMLSQIQATGEGGYLKLVIESSKVPAEDLKKEAAELRQLQQAVEAATAVHAEHAESLTAFHHAVQDMAGELRKGMAELENTGPASKSTEATEAEEAVQDETAKGLETLEKEETDEEYLKRLQSANEEPEDVNAAPPAEQEPVTLMDHLQHHQIVQKEEDGQAPAKENDKKE